MNTLEKLFEAIKTAPSPRLKDYATNEMVRQMREYEDHVLYMLRSVYELLCSTSSACRSSGARILGSMEWFSYAGTLELSAAASEHVYLQARDIVAEGGRSKRDDQRSDLIKRLRLAHADSRFLDTIDFKAAGAPETKLNTADIEEKAIENVYDFFEAINVLVLSPDWFKRHGALLAYAAIFEAINRGGASAAASESSTIKIVLSPNLFSHVYEILKNDKFNDFIDDQTSAPVRETAATLLSRMFPYINDERLIWILAEFLTAADWQEQFSGLISLISLKTFVLAYPPLVDALTERLVPLLESSDEDVKFLSADLLAFLAAETKIAQHTVADIARRCWAQIEDEVDIAHSKASILLLLRVLYSKYTVAHPDTLSCLYPCYTSPLRLIRDSVVELSKIFKGEEILYLLGESILLSADSAYSRRAAGVLGELLDDPDTSSEMVLNLVTHFFRIVSLDAGKPYVENDFACHSDAFFTKDGIAALGRDAVLANRLVLFDVLNNRVKNEDLQTESTKTLLFDTFRAIYSGGPPCDRSAQDENAAATLDDSADSLNAILKRSLDTKFKQYPQLRKMPAREFEHIIDDPAHCSLFRQCNEYALEFIRMVVATNIAVPDVSYYYAVETCRPFARCLTQHKLSRGVGPEMIKSVYDMLIAECVGAAADAAPSFKLRNCVAFFEELGLSVFDDSTADFIMEDEQRLAFFAVMIEFYLKRIRESEACLISSDVPSAAVAAGDRQITAVPDE
ncbi:hypothetical protein PAPHI01_1494 [Pancytospora philotis]|nr:hypothetical protein PAPHI01_1494 [Pancytospora philotis]